MPTLPAELTSTERLQQLASPTTGELVTLDKGVLGELYERLAQAAAAIERGNGRAGGVRQLWSCVDTIFRTGVTPAGCAAAPH